MVPVWYIPVAIPYRTARGCRCIHEWLCQIGFSWPTHRRNKFAFVSPLGFLFAVCYSSRRRAATLLLPSFSEWQQAKFSRHATVRAFRTATGLHRSPTHRRNCGELASSMRAAPLFARTLSTLAQAVMHEYCVMRAYGPRSHLL